MTAYSTRHWRVNQIRGRASDNKCVSCDGRAKEWAQVHGTDGEDPNDYQPMCHQCHQRYDDRWNEEERAKVSDSVRKTWANNPERRVFSKEHIEKLRAARQRRAARERGDAQCL